MRFPVGEDEEQVEEVRMPGFQQKGWAQVRVAPVGAKAAPGPVEAEGSWAPETASSVG